MIIAHLAWWAGWADKMALTSMNVVSRRIFNVNKSVFNTMNIQQLDCYHISCCYGTHILLSCTLHHAASTGLTFSVCEKCVGWCSDETVQYDWVLLKQCRWDKHVFYRHLKSVSCTTSLVMSSFMTPISLTIRHSKQTQRPTRACSTWLGHIHRPEGSAVSGGLRQSKWNSSGQ